MTSGEIIRSYREMRRLSQVQLAELSGINVGTIRKYELGIRNPKPDQLNKIANGLGINVSVFYDLDVDTVGDVAALLFQITEKISVEFTGQCDENGKYMDDTVGLRFKNRQLNKMLKEWADAQKIIDSIKAEAERTDDPAKKEKSQQDADQILKLFKLKMMDSHIVVRDGVTRPTVKMKND